MIDPPRTIAVFRALQLGDMLCSVPALAALRRTWPDARITLIGLPWARSFVERYSMLVDDLAIFPGAPGFPEQDESGRDLPAFVARMRACSFDLAIQLHGSGGPANDIVAAFAARHDVGFVQPGEERSGTFIAWPDALPEPARYLALMQALGIAGCDDRLWFPLNDGDRAECAHLLATNATNEPFIIMHPGSQLPSRRWPVERFAAVADALMHDGHAVVITGSRGEMDLAKALIQRTSKGNPINLVGRTSLGALAALVARAALVICNDTGVSHVAAAMRVPSVVIACGSDTQRWAPTNVPLHRVLAHYPACRPCSFPVCPYAHECAERVTVADVLAATRHQLGARVDFFS